MNRFFCCVLVAALCACSSPVVAQTSVLRPVDTKTELSADLQALTSRFFSLLVAKDVRGAFNELLKNSPIAANTDQVESLVYQTNRTISLYGEMRGHELVSADMLGTSLVRLRYISLHTEYPVRWILTYYKSPSKGWIITNIKFDDYAEDMFTDE